MNELDLQFKNTYGNQVENHYNKSCSTGSKACKNSSNTYRFMCKSCEHSIKETVIKDYSKHKGLDNKLCCPFCLSLQITEVTE